MAAVRSTSCVCCLLVPLVLLCAATALRADVPAPISRVVTTYLDSLRAGEYDKAYNLFSLPDKDRITKDEWVESCVRRAGGQGMDMPEEMMPVFLITQGEATMGETTFKGDEATTPVEIKANLPLKIFLVKQDEQWMVDLQRSDQAQISAMLTKLLEGVKRQGAGMFGGGMMGAFGMVGVMGEVVFNSGMLQRYVQSYDVRSATIEGDRAEVEVVQVAVLKKNAYFKRAGGYWIIDLEKTFRPEGQAEVGGPPGPRGAAVQTQCISNLKQIGVAMMMYADDHDGQLPAANQWCDQLGPYLKNETVFQCPAAPDDECGYAMNFKLSKAKLNEIAHPDQVVLLFESTIGKTNANDDGKTWMPRHNGAGAVLYADGHVAMVRQKPDCRWQRVTAPPKAPPRKKP